MTDFWKTDTYAIVKAMKATGNRPGVIERMKEAVALWASTSDGPDAAAVKAWLPYWQPRPIYQARELAPLWPMLAIAVGFTTHVAPVIKSANRLQNELKFAGLPWREIDGKTYFIVEQMHVWRDAPLSALVEIINAHR